MESDYIDLAYLCIDFMVPMFMLTVFDKAFALYGKTESMVEFDDIIESLREDDISDMEYVVDTIRMEIKNGFTKAFTKGVLLYELNSFYDNHMPRKGKLYNAIVDAITERPDNL